MTTRLPTVVAALSIAGLLGWMVSNSRDVAVPLPAHAGASTNGSLQERSGGSDVPCAVPLAWRIARVDSEFGLSSDEAAAIVREAAALWESDTGESLFAHDPDDGFPIRLVYDERQASVTERATRERAVDQLESRLRLEEEALGARRERHGAAVADFLRRAEDHERRVSEHNAAVRRWNELGGAAPGARVVDLQSIGDSLRVEQEELAAERLPLDAEDASLRGAEDELNERILEHQRLVEELNTAFPPSSVEAGEYREAVTRVNGVVASVSREIRLYRFANASDLRVLAAHELGHALGLGHTQDPTGVMNASARTGQSVGGLATTDVALFRAVCPAI